jgi:hypothetical protein
MQTYTALRTKILNTLNDASSVVFATADLDKFIEDGLRDIAVYHPYVSKELFKIEGRYGTATSTLANNLVDTNQTFLSTDVDKVIYNVTDKTWAVITTFTSASTVVLSKDIMVSGETYKVFNKGCSSNRQINIEDCTDYLWVDRVEYPLGGNPPNYRNVDSIENGILTLGIDFEPNDTAETNADKDCYVYFAKRHKLSQLTDFAGALAASAVVSATTLSATALQGAGTIEADQEFTVSGMRGNYVVSATATIANSAATIVFHPGLENAANSATVFTLKSSTLTPQLEPVLVDLIAGMAAVSKSAQPLQEIVNAISTIAVANTAIANMSAQITAATAFISSGSAQTGSASADIATAATALAKIDAQIAAATVQITAATAVINTIPTAMGADGSYMQAAASDINAGLGYMKEGIAYFQQAQADEGLANNYIGLATASMSAASQYLNQGNGYLGKIRTQLSIAAASDPLKVWGQQKLTDARRRLSRLSGTKTFSDYARD